MFHRRCCRADLRPAARAAIAGLPAETFREIHALDAKLARKAPKRMIGRVLSQREAEELLDRLGA